MGVKFLQQIDAEITRIQEELGKVKENIQSAQHIFEEAKVKQAGLIQELKVVDMMKTNLAKTVEKEDDLEDDEELVLDATDDETDELEKLENE